MSKDVLEYTHEELLQMSDDKLIALQKEANNKNSLFNTSQLVQKLLINSLYGALANRYFPLFNQNIARAITGNGRYFIQKMSKYIEEGLQAMIPSDIPYVFYNDTDSVIGSTIVNTSEGNIKIEDLYNTLGGKLEIRGENNYIKHLNGKVQANSYSTSTESTEMKSINYIMKHKVNKRMFRITHNNRSVVVTEDHSIIIKRGSEYLDISAKNIKKGDKIILLDT